MQALLDCIKAGQTNEEIAKCVEEVLGAASDCIDCICTILEMFDVHCDPQ